MNIRKINNKRHRIYYKGYSIIIKKLHYITGYVALIDKTDNCYYIQYIGSDNFDAIIRFIKSECK